MNIIWIASDTFRQAHIGAYGNKQIETLLWMHWQQGRFSCDGIIHSVFLPGPPELIILRGAEIIAIILSGLCFVTWSPLLSDRDASVLLP